MASEIPFAGRDEALQALQSRYQKGRQERSIG